MQFRENLQNQICIFLVIGKLLKYFPQHTKMFLYYLEYISCLYIPIVYIVIE